MAKYPEIAQRLREFGKKKFTSMSEFAKAVGMKPSSFNVYLSGNARPGPILHERLRELGCDIEWLMTGESSSSFLVKEQEVQYYKNENERLKKENELLKRALPAKFVEYVLSADFSKRQRKILKEKL